MATKNKKITHNIDELFEEYSSSLGLSQVEKDELVSISAKIEAEIVNLTELEESARSLHSEVNSMFPSEVTNEQIQEDIDFITNIGNIIKKYDELNTQLRELEGKSALTESETSQIDAIKEELTSLEIEHNDDMANFAHKYPAGSVEDMINLAKTEVERLEEILDKRDELRIAQDNVLNKRNEIADLTARKEELSSKESSRSVDSLENFKNFLAENNLSTIHAEEIYAHHSNPTENPLMIEDKGFKMRKSHPKRDAFIKKVLIPTAITGAGIGAVVGAIAGSGLIGGSLVLGFIPVSGTPGLTAIATSMSLSFTLKPFSSLM